MPIPKKLPSRGEGATASAKATSGKQIAEPKSQAIVGKRYNIVSHLGSGNFGTVFLVTDTKSHDRKVLKKIKVGEIQPDETIEAVKEATLLSQLDHPAIVKFHDSFLEDDSFYIVTEFCEGGDLSNMIKQVKEAGKVLEESLVLDWFVQLTNAVRYIHDRRVLHRDLKTRNIFLKEGKIKLGDFGISRILVGTSDYATTFTGTPYYMSPEVLKHEGYNSKSDIWSLGVVLYEMCTLEHAFKGQNLMAVMYKIVEGIPPRLPDHFNSSLRHLFIRMLDKDPHRRPSAIEILQDPFIKHHMEMLSQKLALKLSLPKTDPSAEAQAIVKALGPLKRKKEQSCKTKEEEKMEAERALTPRQRMLQRKSQRAEEEAEKIRLAAIQNYSDNQKRYSHIRKKKNKIVPPWVGEHPDIFDDPNFSITAIDISRKEKDQGDESLMDLSVGGASSPSNIQREESEKIDFQVPEEIPEDPEVAETYYSQLDDDFEMEISSESSDPDGDYQAIIQCIEEALGLPEKQDETESVAVAEVQLSEPRPPSPTPVHSHDDFSPFTPLARDKRIALLKEEGQRVLGANAFSQVYEYLKVVRQNSSEMNEAIVMSDLRKLTPNTRDCFIVDQLVFLEKQRQGSELF